MPPKKPFYPSSSFASLRHRAKQKNLPFNLTKKDIVVPKKCPCCGSGFSKDNPASVDRLIPNLGYTKGNVNVICKRCNERKNNSLPPNLRNIADWMEREIENKNRKEDPNDSSATRPPEN